MYSEKPIIGSVASELEANSVDIYSDCPVSRGICLSDNETNGCRIEFMRYLQETKS